MTRLSLGAELADGTGMLSDAAWRALMAAHESLDLDAGCFGFLLLEAGARALSDPGIVGLHGADVEAAQAALVRVGWQPSGLHQ